MLLSIVELKALPVGVEVIEFLHRVFEMRPNWSISDDLWKSFRATVKPQSRKGGRPHLRISLAEMHELIRATRAENRLQAKLKAQKAGSAYVSAIEKIASKHGIGYKTFERRLTRLRTKGNH